MNRRVERWQFAVLLCVFSLGGFLRIKYYAANFSLFVDECALALNFQRTYAALSQTLDYEQRAPLVFLYLVKAVTDSLGRSEYALRLLPLAFGLSTIAAFYVLTRSIFSGWALVAVNLLMCFNQSAISYSAQAKQYSLELLIAVLMLLLSRRLFDADCSPKAFWISSLALGLMPWFSFTSVFVLAGIAVAYVLGQWWSPAGADARKTAKVLCLWAVAFIPVYVVSIRPSGADPALRAMWATQDFPLHALDKIPFWITTKFVEVCALDLNQRLWPLAGVCLACGLVVAALRRNLLLIAGAVAAFACLGAAVLQMYPFSGRLILFLTPGFILLTAAGYQWLRSVFPWGIRRATDLVSTLALFWCMASAVKAYGVRPTFVDEPREALRFVRDNWQAGDRLYATPYSTPCMVYYGRTLGLPSSDVVLNVSAADVAQTNPGSLSVPVSPGRDWLVEMRTDWEKRGQSVPVREYFDARGKRLARKDEEWTSVTLYQIR
jgi:hypothetical protein